MKNTRYFVMLLALTGFTGAAFPEPMVEEKPNVLFIAIDDLRPQLGCYGFKSMHTPRIDELASQGVVFERAYCMVPTCGASRASLLTGIRSARKFDDACRRE